MRIVNFVDDGEVRLGVLAGDRVVDVVRAASERAGELGAELADTITLIRAGERGLIALGRVVSDAPERACVPLASVKLTAPMRPSTILCTGSNYREHNAEKLNTPTSGKAPEFFIKTSDCVVGPNDAIIYDPSLTQKLDCETELAVVIGRPGRHIPLERALQHVFGYTIVNDVTARDRQVRQKDGVTYYELGISKAFETSAPLGPWIVTADEIADPQALSIMTRINGDLRQSSNTGSMIWSCAQLIHYFSRSFTLRPGMVIITGTPAGTAWSTDRELGGKWQAVPGLTPADRYCLPGDAIESEIEKIGVLRNHVVHI